MNDPRIVRLEVESSGQHDERSWSIPLGEGLFLVAVPEGVAPEARIHYRFVDAGGERISAQPGD